MQGAALSGTLPGEPGGREQTLTLGSSLHCFPLGHVVHPDLSIPVLPSPSWSQGRCYVFSGWLLPHRYGCHPKEQGSGGAGKGPLGFRHWLCTAALLLGEGAGTPVLSAVSHRGSWWQLEGCCRLAQGHRGGVGRAPGAAPLCACTLGPDLLPGACTRLHTPSLHAGVLCWWPRCQQWAQLSCSISPMSSHAVGTFFFGV